MRRANKILTSAKTAALAVAVTLLCAGPVLAADYAPFPNVSPGTVYRWKSYLVDEHGNKKLRGIYTNTIEGKTLIGGHEYVVVKRSNPEGKALPTMVYRADPELFGVLFGPSEDSLLVHWKGTPSPGQAWTMGSQKIVIREPEDVDAGGTVYPDCFVLDQFNEGKLVNRSYFDREAGWVKSIVYKDGRETVEGYRLPEGEE